MRVHSLKIRGTEIPNQPDEPANAPPAQEFPSPAPTEQVPAYDRTPPAKPPLDTVSLFALITAGPGLGPVSAPLVGVRPHVSVGVRPDVSVSAG
jgi:hypothetical protein